jgi:hypothetical protein
MNEKNVSKLRNNKFEIDYKNIEKIIAIHCKIIVKTLCKIIVKPLCKIIVKSLCKIKYIFLITRIDRIAIII